MKQTPTRSLSASHAAVALIVLAMPLKTVSAQQADPPQAVVELPAVVITTPSPVKGKKPVKAVASGPGSESPASQGSESQPQPVVAAAPLDPVPGLVIVDDAFIPVTFVTEREILARQTATVADALATKPGISASSFAPGASRPVIRGLDNSRVRIQENGIGSHDVSALSEDHAVPIDPFAADHIEVVRGPAALRFGGPAMGGVVAVENQRIPTVMPRNGFSGEVRGGLSSGDEGRDGAFKATAGSRGVVVHADGFRRSAEDYATPKGRETNSFVDSEGLSAGASYIWRSGFIGISINRIKSLYGIPGEEAAEGLNPRIDLVQDKVQAKGEWHVQDSGVDAIRFWFGASDYEHDELAIHDPDHDKGFEIGSHFTNREQEARVEIQHLPVGTMFGDMNGAIGVHWGNRRTRGQSFEGESLLEPAHTRSLAGFWFEELDLNRWLRLQAAARIEHTTVDGRGWAEFAEHGHAFHAHDFEGRRSFTPLSGSLGMLYELPFSTVARLTGQYVERAPEAAELFSKGLHEATGTFEVGNPFLDIEKAATLEAGLKKAAGALRFDASVYATRFNGFIYRQATGLECDPASHNGHFHCDPHGAGGNGGHGHDHAFDLMYFDQRNATFVGAEIAVQYDVARLWKGVWGIDGQYDFVHARFDNGENVPRIPPHRLGGGLYYKDTNWFARAGLLHAFDQNRIGAGEIATPGYTLVSAELSYTAELDPADGLGKTVTLGIRGDNLANDEVLNHASFKRREEVVLPGASVRVFGSISLN